MPFARPTLTELRDQSIEDITTSGVPGLAGLLRKAVLRVLAWCIAGMTYLVYGYADWIARMGVPFTAEDEYLYAWAALIGVYPKEATPSTGQAQFTGAAGGGQIISLGTPLTRQDGTPYTVTTEGVVDTAGNVVVGITCDVAGAFTNSDPGVAISIAIPVAGVNSGGVIGPGPAYGGSDQETQAELRTRMLAKYRAPPQGGAVTDYEEWAAEVPGVTRAWAHGGGYGAGSVVVYVMLDDAQSVHGGFPQGTDGCARDETRGPTASGDQLTVAEHLWTVQPVTSLVYVAAPAPYPVDVTLVDLLPDTAETRAAIAASLADAFRLEGAPGGIIYPSDLYEAILATPGLFHFTMTVPALPLQLPQNGLPVLGTLAVVQ